MKQLLLLILIFALNGCATTMKKENPKDDSIRGFRAVWEVVESDSYEVLPQNEVSFFKLFSLGEDTILKDASRTLVSHADILEPFEKLVHPNGICFKGVWEIDSPSIYSGYFKEGILAPIIVRASSALSNTKSGESRAFGFAGKIFPDEESKNQTSANFFLIDDLGGTDSKYYTDVTLTNEPTISINFEVIKNLMYALKISHAFSQADKNPNIRQLYEISELGESGKIITPRWMKLEVKDSKKVGKKDFRDELRIAAGEKLIFSISVANEILNSKKIWKEIGTITLDTSIVSYSCDHRLHFHHPKWKEE